ncbi:MAG: 4Fe-4S binding protein [Dehalococcoidia bacterium]|nr:4Fe-4S binding protein [Dehalococcoidia bacterium]
MRTTGAMLFRRPAGRAWRRLLLAVVSALVAVSLLAAPVLACDISIESAKTSGQVGDTLVFTVTVYQTHRNCSVPIDDTQIRLTGMQLMSETGWKQIASMTYENELSVTLTAEGKGTLEVVRVCPKGGGEAVAIVTIGPAAGVSTEDEEETPPLVPVVPAADGTVLPGTADEGEETVTPAVAAAGPTFGDALADTLSEPYIIVLLALMAGGTFAVARGYRRARPFAMLISVGFLGFYIGGCPCPIGSLQNSIIYLGDIAGHMPIYVQFVAVVLFTLLFGRVFCGWACPLGATQFFMFRKEAGKKNRRLEIPREQHNVLRWMKYGVLAALIGLVILTGRPVFEEVDPFRVLFNLDFRWGVPLVFLVVLLAVSIVIGFPFCKYLCPLGAFLGLLQPLSLFKIRFGSSCTNCKTCHTVACDYGAIEPGEKCPTVNQRECVRCGECLSRCPCGAISFTAGRRARP